MIAKSILATNRHFVCDRLAFRRLVVCDSDICLSCFQVLKRLGGVANDPFNLEDNSTSITN